MQASDRVGTGMSRKGARPETWILAIAVVYALFALCLTTALGRPPPILPPHVVEHFTWAAIAVAAALTGMMVASSTSRFPGLFLRGARSPMRLAHAAIGALGIFVFVCAFSAVKTSMTDLSPFLWDEVFADLDHILHFGRDPWTFYVPLAEPLLPFLEYLYMTTWSSVSLLLPLAVMVFEPDPRQLKRFFICYFSVWIVLGNVLALVFLSGGPIYFGEITGSDRFAPLLEWLYSHREALPGTIWAREALWAAHEANTTFIGSGISAMPSVHVGLATLTALYAGRAFGVAGAVVGLVYLAIIQIGSVALAWHYAIDGYLSMVCVGLLWLVLRPRDAAAQPDG